MSVFEDIDEFLKDKPFGEFPITIKKHKGEYVLVDIHSAENVKYSSNEVAFAQMLQFMKDCVDSGFSGTMTFDIKFGGGKVKHITRHGYKRIAYDENVVH